MMMSNTTLLLTKDPSHPLAFLALRYARAYLSNQSKHPVNAEIDSDIRDTKLPPLKCFFYADAANIANRFRWQSADQMNLTKAWQNLAQEFDLVLPVCVSTALSRGISDADNSVRHHLEGDNLANGFTLVGLSELTLMMQNSERFLQF